MLHMGRQAWSSTIYQCTQTSMSFELKEQVLFSLVRQ
jgi:hypothetical protein